MNRIKEISKEIDELLGGDEISEKLSLYESWMCEQLNRIREFKQKSKPLFYNEQIFTTICQNSELITGFDFRVLKDTGFFSYLFAVEGSAETYPFNFLDFIKKSYQAEFLAFFKENESSEFTFLFETRIHASVLKGFKVILKVKSLVQKREFSISIKSIQVEEEDQGHSLWGFQNESNMEQSGISLLLFGANYNIIDHVGSEVLFSGNKMQNTLFDSCGPESSKRIYPFISRALKGLFNCGDVRINGNLFNVCAFPVNDQDGFTNATVLLTKENFS